MFPRVFLVCFAHYVVYYLSCELGPCVGRWEEEGGGVGEVRMGGGECGNVKRWEG